VLADQLTTVQERLGVLGEVVMLQRHGVQRDLSSLDGSDRDAVAIVLPDVVWRCELLQPDVYTRVLIA
jgi:hypothetical protein